MGFIAAALASKTDYDVIVVGSGAAGGQTAYTLAMEGARVLMLEAGRRYSPEAETPMFQTPQQAPLRAAGTPDKPFGFHDATVDGGWQVPGEPYVKGAVIADEAKAIAPGGSIIHEVGDAIMGADARRSVTNQCGQTWDVTNLFITDGAVFASNADKNPTLTIMALAWRCADRILDLMRRKEL